MRRVAAYQAFVRLATRHARRSGEAEDIVQEVLIAAVIAGRDDFSVPANRRWAAGAIRRRAAFDARSAARRRDREARWQAEHGWQQHSSDDDTVETVLADLPQGLRIVAALTLSGHTRAEIAYLLELSDAAMRQRVRSLKLALARKGVSMPSDMTGLSLDIAYGAIRQALVPALRRQGGAFATHDPDGHIFVVRRSQK